MVLFGFYSRFFVERKCLFEHIGVVWQYLNLKETKAAWKQD